MRSRIRGASAPNSAGVALAFLGVGHGDRAHGAQLDVTTGAVLAPPAPAPVSGYRLRVDHDDITVEV
jgi:uncharacterized membrane protein